MSHDYIFYFESSSSHLIFYKFVIPSHILSRKNVITLSLSLIFILFCNSTLGWWIIVSFYNTILGWYNWWCVFEFSITSLVFPSYSFCLIFVWLIVNYFGSENLNLYQNKIFTVYLNVLINYLSNIKCNFVMHFDNIFET